MKKKPIIRVDTREKLPWKFTAAFNGGKIAGINVEAVEAGDYCLEEFPYLVTVERKKNVAELYNNFVPTENMERFEREMTRLQKYQFKYIVVEQPWEALYNQENFKYMAKTKQWAGMVVLGKLLYVMNTYGVFVIFAGDHAEHTTCSILLKHYYDWLKHLGLHHKNGKPKRNTP